MLRTVSKPLTLSTKYILIASCALAVLSISSCPILLFDIADPRCDIIRPKGNPGKYSIILQQTKYVQRWQVDGQDEYGHGREIVAKHYHKTKSGKLRLS